jgi:N-hydroxyarylamine O-acetyltransferase
MTFQPDLDAYFTRIGYTGPRTVDRATLDAIVRAHISALPFENIDVLLDRGIDLDPAAVERKLVHARRGGYCFEHNSHLLHVLGALGFAVTPLSARVRIQRPRDFTPARTHLFVRVDLDGPLLADVGVGGLSPTASLRLDLIDAPQPTPHETRRIMRVGGPDDGRWFHQARLGEDWADVCEFTGEVMPEIDRVVGNWFTSTHPRSHFRDRLMVARATAGGRVSILNRTLTLRDGDGRATTRALDSASALGDALEAHFGLVEPEVGRLFALLPA